MCVLNIIIYGHIFDGSPVIGVSFIIDNTSIYK